MQRDIVLGLARHALTTAGGALAARGVIGLGTVEAVNDGVLAVLADPAAVETLCGGLVALLGAVWSWLAKRAKAAPAAASAGAA